MDDLEAAMKKGVAIVSFDCASMRVLSNCSLPDTSYEYAGTTRNERVVQMEGRRRAEGHDALQRGQALRRGPGGQVDRHRPRARRQALRPSFRRSRRTTWEFRGRETHFVQNAWIGRVLDVDRRRGQGRRRRRALQRRRLRQERVDAQRDVNGSLEACRTSKDDADAPPAGLPRAAPHRAPADREGEGGGEGPEQGRRGQGVQEGRGEEAGGEGRGEPVPEGHRLGEREVHEEETAAALGRVPLRREEARRVQGAVRQGPRGLLLGPHGVHAKRAQYADDAASKALAKTASTWFQKACDGNHAEGCTELAEEIVGPKYDEKLADHLEAFKKSVNGKHALLARQPLGLHRARLRPAARGQQGVRRLGLLPLLPEGVQPGNSMGCREAAEGYIQGLGTAKNPKKGTDLLLKGCTGGDDDICKAYITTSRTAAASRRMSSSRRPASTRSSPASPTTRPARWPRRYSSSRARTPTRSSTRSRPATASSRPSAETLYTMYAEGKGTKKDPAKAKELLENVRRRHPEDRLRGQVRGGRGAPEARGRTEARQEVRRARAPGKFGRAW